MPTDATPPASDGPALSASATSTAGPLPAVPRVLFIAGSGRSGTSVMASILQQLGMHVPQPEVAADPSNPRGFAEPRWVVDFHNRLLGDARVHPSDARPSAWFETGRTASRPEVRSELHTWLADQLETSPDLLVKDPRLVWFLPLWSQLAGDLGAAVSVITMLRHPAEVVASKGHSYPRGPGVVNRLAGWLNLMLYTERATRDLPRAFIRYADLLEDWTSVVAPLGETLDLPVISGARARDMRRAHRVVEPELRREQPSWDQLEIPARLRELAEEVWSQLENWAERGEPGDALRALDQARTSYTAIYQEAEGIAESSISATSTRAASVNAVVPATAGGPGLQPAAPPSETAAQQAPMLLDRIASKVPHRYRERIPPEVRAKLRQLLGAGTDRQAPAQEHR